jgi:hypothetical protein
MEQEDPAVYNLEAEARPDFGPNGCTHFGG